MPTSPGSTEAADPSSRPAEDASVVASLRRLLKIETERLRMRQGMGLGGVEIAAARSAMLDQVVTRACREAGALADGAGRRELLQCAVVALGGYGRQEVSPCSDVDLLFLHAGGTSPALAAFVERALVTLWDAGLTVGHSFRSPRECVAIARDDLQSRTALLEARLVTGNQALFDTLRAALEWGPRRSRG